MARPLHIDWQEDEETLYQLYKQEKDVQNRTQLQALWLLRQGRSMREVAAIVGKGCRSMQRLVDWYRQGGLEEIKRHRHGGQGGRSPYLSKEQEAALRTKSEAGGLKTIWDGVVWVEKIYNVKYTYGGMRGVFERLKLRKKVPRPKSPKASAEEQEAWKKGG